MRSRKWLLGILVLALSGTVLLLPKASGRAAEGLAVTGTGSSIRVMEIMAEGFKKTRPDVKVEVLPSIGSSGAIKAVVEGKIDVGLSARSLKEEEMAYGIREEAYGRVAFIFATDSSNPAGGLTIAEIEEMYSGKRTVWPSGIPVRIVLRPLGDSYSVYLAGISPGMKGASEKAHAMPGLYVGITDQEAARQIETTPGSLGVTSSSIVAAEKRRIKALAVNGVFPTAANLASGKYAYSMPMYLVYRKGAGKPAVQDFLRFVFSDPGRKILSRTGHVPIKRMPDF